MADDTEIKIREHGIEALGRFYGSYRGFVASNEDPEFLGRVKLKVPQIWGEDTVLDYWAWSKGIPVGNGMGLYLIPSENDMVWVSFEGGDPRFPIWEYGHFNKIQPPDAEWKTNGIKPTNVVWQTAAGHRITLDGKPNNEKISITHKAGDSVILDDSGIILKPKLGNTIELGGATGSEPAIKGDKLQATLDELIALVASLAQLLGTFAQADATTATSFGLTYPATINAFIPTFNNNLVHLQQTLLTIKSDIVKLN